MRYREPSPHPSVVPGVRSSRTSPVYGRVVPKYTGGLSSSHHPLEPVTSRNGSWGDSDTPFLSEGSPDGHHMEGRSRDPTREMMGRRGTPPSTRRRRGDWVPWCFGVTRNGTGNSSISWSDTCQTKNRRRVRMIQKFGITVTKRMRVEVFKDLIFVSYQRCLRSTCCPLRGFLTEFTK